MVSSLISPVLSPPAGSSANPSPQGFREPVPAPCAPFPHGFQAYSVSRQTLPWSEAGQSDVDKMGHFGSLGASVCKFLAVARQGPACVVPQTFHHSRAVGGREVGHPARRLGGPQEAATEHVPNTLALPHRQTESRGFFLRTFVSFLPRVPPELEADARRSRVSVSSRQGNIG